MAKIAIKAVHDSDLEKFLAKLGLLDKIKEGKIRCGICGEVITLDNFLCVYPEEGQIKVCCNKRECYEKVFAKSKF